MILFAIFVALQAADIWTTHSVLSRPGGRELNPLLARLFARFGHLPVLLVFKAVVVCLFWRYVLGNVVAFGSYHIGGDQLLLAFCVFYSAIVTNNYCNMRWKQGFIQLASKLMKR